MQKKTNKINGVPTYWKASTINLKGGNNEVTFGKNVFMRNTRIKLFGNASLTLDDGIYMEGCTFMIKDSHVHFGRNTEMMRVTVSAYSQSRIDIGDNSTLTGEFDAKNHGEITAVRLWCTWPPLIAANDGRIIMKDCGTADSVIYNSDYHPIYDFFGKRINPNKDVVIEDNVWVGRKTTVLKGVTLGNGCILGFGTIVSKDVPPHCIVAGQPAKIVKENVVYSITEKESDQQFFPLHNEADADEFFRRSRDHSETIRKHPVTWKPGNYLRTWVSVMKSK